jgi:hypoxanthine phosphoribosyltransferase
MFTKLFIWIDSLHFMASKPIIIPDNDNGYSKDQFSVPTHYTNYVDNIMIPQGLINDRIEKLAQEIHEDYQGKKLYVVCVLKGGEKIFSDLTNNLHKLNSRYGQKSIPLQHDFIKASSYINTNTSGNVNVQTNSNQLENFRGKEILLVEDIVDTGKTLNSLTDIIKQYCPASIKVVSLLTKRLKDNSFNADYVGFSIPEKFVVGYCLDYNEHFRDLQHICVLNSEGQERFRK